MDDTDTVHAYGVARASRSEPGSVTLTFSTVKIPWTPGTPIRVPANWLKELREAP